MKEICTRTSTQLPPSPFQPLDQRRHLRFLRFEIRLYADELRLEFDVLLVVDRLRRVADDGAEEFLFGDLFEVGEAEFGE